MAGFVEAWCRRDSDGAETLTIEGFKELPLGSARTIFGVLADGLKQAGEFIANDELS